MEFTIRRLHVLVVTDGDPRVHPTNRDRSLNVTSSEQLLTVSGFKQSAGRFLRCFEPEEIAMRLSITDNHSWTSITSIRDGCTTAVRSTYTMKCDPSTGRAASNVAAPCIVLPDTSTFGEIVRHVEIN